MDTRSSLVAVILTVLSIVFFAPGVMGQPGGGPPNNVPPNNPPPGNPGGGVIETTNEVSRDHILAVTGDQSEGPNALVLEVFPTSSGIWSGAGSPSNRFNPLSLMEPLDAGGPDIELGVLNTVDNVNEIAGAMRFEAAIDATNRYDFEGVEFFVTHDNQNLLEETRLLGRLSTAITERFGKGEFRLGGSPDRDVEPEVGQIRRLGGQEMDEFTPIWKEFEDDRDSRRRRTGIYPNLPSRESSNNRPGHYRVNYNIRSSNQEALSRDDGSYDPFVPGNYQFTARVHTANGETFEETANFPVHGLAAFFEDEAGNPIRGENVDVKAASEQTCNYFPEDLPTVTDEDGLLSIVMQPNQSCDVEFQGDFTFLPPGPVDIPVLSGGSSPPGPLSVSNSSNFPTTVVVPTKHRLRGTFDPLNSSAEPEGIVIEAEPIGPDAQRVLDIATRNNLDLQTQVDDSNEYLIELPAGEYRVTARAPDEDKFIRPVDSTQLPEPEYETQVTVDPVSFSEAKLSGIPEQELDWEMTGLATIQTHVMKFNLDGLCRNAQETDVELEGNTVLGDIERNKNTGTFLAVNVFEDLPPGDYTAKASVTYKADPSTQNYSASTTLDDGSDKSLELGPDSCF